MIKKKLRVSPESLIPSLMALLALVTTASFLLTFRISLKQNRFEIPQLMASESMYDNIGWALMAGGMLVMILMLFLSKTQLVLMVIPVVLYVAGYVLGNLDALMDKTATGTQIGLLAAVIIFSWIFIMVVTNLLQMKEIVIIPGLLAVAGIIIMTVLKQEPFILNDAGFTMSNGECLSVTNLIQNLGYYLTLAIFSFSLTDTYQTEIDTKKAGKNGKTVAAGKDGTDGKAGNGGNAGEELLRPMDTTVEKDGQDLFRVPDNDESVAETAVPTEEAGTLDDLDETNKKIAMMTEQGPSFEEEMNILGEFTMNDDEHVATFDEVIREVEAKEQGLADAVADKAEAAVEEVSENQNEAPREKTLAELLAERGLSGSGSKTEKTVEATAPAEVVSEAPKFETEAAPIEEKSAPSLEDILGEAIPTTVTKTSKPVSVPEEDPVVTAKPAGEKVREAAEKIRSDEPVRTVPVTSTSDSGPRKVLKEEIVTDREQKLSVQKKLNVVSLIGMLVGVAAVALGVLTTFRVVTIPRLENNETTCFMILASGVILFFVTAARLFDREYTTKIVTNDRKVTREENNWEEYISGRLDDNEKNIAMLTSNYVRMTEMYGHLLETTTELTNSMKALGTAPTAAALPENAEWNEEEAAAYNVPYDAPYDKAYEAPAATEYAQPVTEEPAYETKETNDVSSEVPERTENVTTFSFEEMMQSAISEVISDDAPTAAEEPAYETAPIYEEELPYETEAPAADEAPAYETAPVYNEELPYETEAPAADEAPAYETAPVYEEELPYKTDGEPTFDENAVIEEEQEAVPEEPAADETANANADLLSALFSGKYQDTAEETPEETETEEPAEEQKQPETTGNYNDYLISTLFTRKPVENTETAAEEAAETVEEAVEKAEETAEEVTETALETAEEAAETVVEEAAETMDEVTETAAEVAEEVTETVEEVAETAAEAAEEVTETMDEVAETAAEATEEVAETVEEVTETAAEVAEEVAETVEEAVEEVTETVEEAAEETAENTIEEISENVDEKPILPTFGYQLEETKPEPDDSMFGYDGSEDNETPILPTFGYQLNDNRNASEENAEDDNSAYRRSIYDSNSIGAGINAETEMPVVETPTITRPETNDEDSGIIEGFVMPTFRGFGYSDEPEEEDADEPMYSTYKMKPFSFKKTGDEAPAAETPAQAAEEDDEFSFGDAFNARHKDVFGMVAKEEESDEEFAEPDLPMMEAEFEEPELPETESDFEEPAAEPPKAPAVDEEEDERAKLEARRKMLQEKLDQIRRKNQAKEFDDFSDLDEEGVFFH